MPTNQQPSTPTATASTPAVSLINAYSGTVVAGTPVYSSASGSFNRAISDSAAHARVIGLAMADIAAGIAGLIQVASIITLTTAQWDAVVGSSGGLIFDTDYWLDIVAGKLLAVDGPTAAGKYVTYIGFALSTTQLKLGIQPPIGPIVL